MSHFHLFEGSWMIEIVTWSENENATWPSCCGNENESATQSDSYRRASLAQEREPPDLRKSSSYVLPPQ